MDATTEIRTRARRAADEVQREVIAEATCRVIASEGLEAASLRRIGVELDCTTGLITHYFGSKEELLVAVLRWAARRLGEVVTQGRGASSDPLGAHLEYFYASLPVDDERRNYWRVLLSFRSATIGDATLAAVYREYSEEMELVMRRSIGASVGRDEADPEVVRIAKGVGALLEGIGISASEDPSTYTEDFVRAIVTPMVDGLVGPLGVADGGTRH